MITFVTPDGQTFSTPSGCTRAQAEAIAAATTVQVYADGEDEFITVLTRCGPPAGADPVKWEMDPSFWYDGNWIDWVVATYPGWSWISGTGEYDSGGEWFAQEHRLGDQFIWLALGSRSRRLFGFGALIDALRDRGIPSEVVDTGGQTMRLTVAGPNGIEVMFSDEHTDAIAYGKDDGWTQYDAPEPWGRELPDGIWDKATAEAVATWFAGILPTITVEEE